MSEAEEKPSVVEALSDQLAFSFGLCQSDVLSTDAPHPRYHLLKKKGLSDQNGRRKAFLERMRKRRTDFHAKVREIALGSTVGNTVDNEGDFAEECESEDQEKAVSLVKTDEVLGGMTTRDKADCGRIGSEDVTTTMIPNVNVDAHAGRRKRGRNDHENDEYVGQSNKWVQLEESDVVSKPKKASSYKDQLMLSEWMDERPVDLATHWLVKICPVGKRCMVVSSQGQTRAFLRNGFCIEKFHSALPGGRKLGGRTHEYCILDCIFDQHEKIFYVIDVMCWKSQPLYDSDAEFRFYWAQTKIEETSGIGVASRYNTFRFSVLTANICDDASLKVAIATPSSFTPDGLLFIHKEVHYEAGRNPAVLWLRFEMVDDIMSL
eukprot:CFRG8563T1